MKKIYNYLCLKLSSKKIIGIIFLVFIYQFLLFLEIINQDLHFNIYDLIQKQFSYLPLFIFISLGFLLIVHDIANKNAFYKYLDLKFKNKINLYHINILITVICSIFYVILLNLFAIVEGLGKIYFNNSWSSYFFNTMTGNINVFYNSDIIEIITNNMTPLEFTIITNILVIFYLTFLGCLFLTVNSITKKRNLSFLIVIMINSFNMGVDSLNKYISKISFTNNIYITTSSYNSISNNFYFILRVSYWLLILLFIYIIGRYFIIHRDCKYED